MKFISAGHCNIKGPNYDPGAVGVNGRTEASETVRVRNEVIRQLKVMGHTDIIQDADNESLAQYLNRIKPGNASVIVEFHFNAATPAATGVETIIELEADRLDKLMANEFSSVTAQILGIKNRGVISEAQSHRGRLGLMREEGIINLVEVAFISNSSDMANYDKNFIPLCNAYAGIIAKYDELIK